VEQEGHEDSEADSNGLAICKYYPVIRLRRTKETIKTFARETGVSTELKI
jgi:hypothetical protein